MATLKDEYKQMLLKLSSDDITAEFMYKYLGDTAKVVNGKFTTKASLIRSDDTFVLEKNEYFNKEKITTNVGLFIYNKFLIEENLIDVVGYVNETIDNKKYKKIERLISNALLNDVITTENMVTYLNKLHWLTYTFHAMVSKSFTMNTLKPLHKITKHKEKLVKENKKALDDGDLFVAVKIEDELVELAKSELKGDPGIELYDSGARGSFGNNYKNLQITRGPIYNPITDRFDFVNSSYTEGIKKKELSKVANGIPSGAYPKAVGTQVSGYFSKQLTAAFQGVVLDSVDSDCGTTNTLDIVVTPWMKSQLLDRYIVEGNKFILLDLNNIDKYVNKKVKLRSPMYCIGDKLCGKCAGILFYKLQIKNVGLTTSRIANILKQASMKKYHDSTAKVNRINLDELTL